MLRVTERMTTDSPPPVYLPATSLFFPVPSPHNVPLTFRYSFCLQLVSIGSQIILLLTKRNDQIYLEWMKKPADLNVQYTCLFFP